MLRRSVFQTILSDGSTHADFTLASNNKYLILRQDFNSHPFWIGHLIENFLKKKKYTLYLHSNYKIKTS
jgi:hypothetical protein